MPNAIAHARRTTPKAPEGYFGMPHADIVRDRVNSEAVLTRDVEILSVTDEVLTLSSAGVKFRHWTEEVNA